MESTTRPPRAALVGLLLCLLLPLVSAGFFDPTSGVSFLVGPAGWARVDTEGVPFRIFRADRAFDAFGPDKSKVACAGETECCAPGNLTLVFFNPHATSLSVEVFRAASCENTRLPLMLVVLPYALVATAFTAFLFRVLRSQARRDRERTWSALLDERRVVPPEEEPTIEETFVALSGAGRDDDGDTGDDSTGDGDLAVSMPYLLGTQGHAKHGDATEVAIAP